ncbi:MAG: four helix bundle protein [Gemmatimonas sp.]|uniref:four helix bundle protein n=1 Tax=Gemmatimonas sp. TaxID=1962908 RepID=UPI0022CA4E00|nr:four helix bundle protein [Gemmatimonas sp.]MCZ8012411.1 four helix bundle protein [Gemmatimonas sp.]MCZ8268689.1 four helix bundle protein [Gemmatimonas sp.]
MQNPTNLQVYHRAIDFAAAVHRLARRIRTADAPGLANQLARAAASIPANIAEGVGHPNPGRCPFHLGVAIASGFEVETHLRLARKIGCAVGTLDPVLDELDQIRRMLYTLREYNIRRLGRGTGAPDGAPLMTRQGAGRRGSGSGGKSLPPSP